MRPESGKGTGCKEFERDPRGENPEIDQDIGRSRGFGFVEMSDGAEAAIEALNETEHSGRALRVNQAKPREDRN